MQRSFAKEKKFSFFKYVSVASVHCLVVFLCPSNFFKSFYTSRRLHFCELFQPLKIFLLSNMFVSNNLRTSLFSLTFSVFFRSMFFYWKFNYFCVVSASFEFSTFALANCGFIPFIVERYQYYYVNGISRFFKFAYIHNKPNTH